MEFHETMIDDSCESPKSSKQEIKITFPFEHFNEGK